MLKQDQPLRTLICPPWQNLWHLWPYTCFLASLLSDQAVCKCKHRPCLCCKHCARVQSVSFQSCANTAQRLGVCQVHKLREQEQHGQQSKPKRPRAVVLGPTRELTDQILQVAKSLCHHARFRSACVNGGASFFCFTVLLWHQFNWNVLSMLLVS